MGIYSVQLTFCLAEGWVGGKEEEKSLRNWLVVLFLGCIPTFNVQLCLELVNKFVVVVLGGWVVRKPILVFSLA